ncbi:MAG: hypothetical protein NWQ27_05120 [Crocinitomicaceae bacterium]|nr:hypothetical protein [Crocinitomicaceae bacterium]
MRFYLSLFIVMVLFGSCSQQEPIIVERGMYYWESAANSFSDNEIKFLHNTGISKLYLKLFEVTYDSKMGAIPISKTNFSEANQLKGKEIIPCVYIQNSVFTKMDKYELEDFVENALFLITTMMKEELGVKNKPKEIQIDCDWTSSTKENYFQFLKSLGEKTNSKISCTLRLYPYKYHEKMGVPPVDRVMLMCYNLLSPKNNDSKNSIFDLKEFEKYTDTKINYPLPMDYALPKYSWNICYENKTFKGVIHGPQPELKPYLKKVNSLWSILQKDTVINDIYLRRGYRIKNESISSQNLKDLIDQLKKNSSFKDTITVSFFQLDEEEFKTTSHEELDHLYHRFSK